MNGSTENTAHGASEKPGRREIVLNLGTARNMVPLVQRIVADILHHQQCLAELTPEQDRLERDRRSLAWSERSRRYQIQEELKHCQQCLHEAQVELARLGVVLIDAAEGRVGFPTIVNNRRAFFSWCQGEDTVHYWHFPNQTKRRPIPASWLKSANISMSGTS
jgi:hypothetical protein